MIDRSGSLDQRAELIRDTASEVDVHEFEQEQRKKETTKKRWKRPDETYVCSLLFSDHGVRTYLIQYEYVCNPTQAVFTSQLFLIMHLLNLV